MLYGDDLSYCVDADWHVGAKEEVIDPTGLPHACWRGRPPSRQPDSQNLLHAGNVAVTWHLTDR